jgi:6-phosphogluconate dehydrogenase (decarboxylating)
VEAAAARGLAVPVIEEALRFRERSAADPSYTGRILQALRNEFGGHGLGSGGTGTT